jgi:hypothetical protein
MLGLEASTYIFTARRLKERVAFLKYGSNFEAQRTGTHERLAHEHSSRIAPFAFGYKFKVNCKCFSFVMKCK